MKRLQQRSITIKYCISVIAMQQSPATSTRLLVFFVSCENKLRHYKRGRDLRCTTPGIVQCRNATLLAIKQLRKITLLKFTKNTINQLHM